MRNVRAGFTIVELLIVIIVVAILAAITIVAYTGVQERGMDTRIRSTVENVGKSLQIASLEGQRPGAQGYFSNANGVDSFVTARDLLAGYRDDITSVNSNHVNHTFRYYLCKEDFVIYAALNKPSEADIQGLKAAKTQCGHTTQAPETGAVSYNYARIFN